MRGFTRDQIITLGIPSVFKTLTTKHTVNHGLRIFSIFHAEQGVCALTTSLYNALTSFRSYGIAQ
jgi:hypothetical protein